MQPSTKTASTGTGTRNKDYNDEMSREQHEMHHNIINNNTRRNKSKSTEDMNVGMYYVIQSIKNNNKLNSMKLDPTSLKRMLKPMPSTESPVTSPEMGRRRYNYYNNAMNMAHAHQHAMHAAHMANNNTLTRSSNQSSRFSGSRYILQFTYLLIFCKVITFTSFKVIT